MWISVIVLLFVAVVGAIVLLNGTPKSFNKRKAAKAVKMQQKYNDEPKMQDQKFVMAYDPYIHSRILRRFETWTKPALPYKRGITDIEYEVLHQFYKDFGWCDIDAEGRVILNGGECADGMFYITEEDLKEVVKRLT